MHQLILSYFQNVEKNKTLIEILQNRYLNLNSKPKTNLIGLKNRRLLIAHYAINNQCQNVSPHEIKNFNEI